jgi:hypothetical protein
MNKKEAWQYYKTWMREKTYCKALETEIKITRKGWDHLTFGSNKRNRSRKDQVQKYQLMPLAKYVIKHASVATVTRRSDKVYYELNYKVKTKRNNKYIYLAVRVLIKKNKFGELSFYSVMQN